MSIPKESGADMLARVRMMADGGDTWDLSINDIFALNHVMAVNAELLDALKAARAILTCMGVTGKEEIIAPQYALITAAIAKAEGSQTS